MPCVVPCARVRTPLPHRCDDDAARYSPRAAVREGRVALEGPMIGTGFLDALPIWAVFALTFGLSVLACEVGYRMGRAWKRRRPGSTGEAGGVMVGATLAMLAFFLAFLVGMAVDRFDGRRAMIMDEANTIGTTWLRAGYLPAPYPEEVRPILAEYTAQRLQLPLDTERAITLQRSNELMNDLWAKTEQLVRENPNSESVSLFVETVNDTIDMGSKRAVALNTWRVPWTIWVAAYLVAFASMMLVGFHAGNAGTRNWPEVLLLALVFAAVMNLIVDLDRPYDGLLQVSQEALLELRAAIGR
jgi:hypothetical protein